MASNITFSHSAAKGCWVSEEIRKASMAYIQVERKEPGFLRVYTSAPGQNPALAHVSQQANTAFCVGVLHDDVAVMMESETEVTSASVCGGAVGASLAAVACDSNLSGYVSVYRHALGSPCYMADLGDGNYYARPSYFLLTSEEFGKVDGMLIKTSDGEISKMSREDLAYLCPGVDGKTVAEFSALGVDISGYDYIFVAGFLLAAGEGELTFLYDGKEYPLDVRASGDASTQQAEAGLRGIRPVGNSLRELSAQLSARLAARKEVKA